MSRGRYIPVFTAAFPFIYVPTMSWNWPLVTYLPRSGQWHPLFFAAPPVAAPGPGMYFWGWMLTAAIGAAIVSVIASFLPEKIVSRIVPLVPVCLACGVVGLVYALRQWWVFG